MAWEHLPEKQKIRCDSDWRQMANEGMCEQKSIKSKLHWCQRQYASDTDNTDIWLRMCGAILLFWVGVTICLGIQ